MHGSISARALRLLLVGLITLTLTACPAPGGGPAPVRLLTFPGTPELTFVQAIQGAQRRVLVTVYLLTDLRIVDALAAARAKGLEVRVLLEGNPYGATVAAQATLTRLQEAGIAVKAGNPAFRYTHQKSLITDDSAYILTNNLTRAAVQANREFGIVIEGAAEVSEIVGAFEADWARTPFAPANPRLIWSPLNSRSRLTGMIDAAQTSLEIYAEVVQDDAIVAALGRAAQRGISTRVLIAPADAGSTAEGNGDVGVLLGAGVQVRVLRNPYAHAKVIIVDASSAFVGSQNLTFTSIERNRELGITIGDPGALRSLRATFEADWASVSAP